MDKRKILFMMCFIFTLIATGCTSRESQPSNNLQVQESVSEPSSSQQSNIVPAQDSAANAVSSSSSQSSVSSIASDSEPSSSQSAQNSSTAPSSSSAANIEDPFDLLGEGLGITGVAIVVYDSSSDNHLELKKTEGGELLSKIDFSKFTVADMVQEITPPPRGALPDPLPEYTQGNYIMLGRMNGTLYIYETLGQALLLDEYNESYYYDIPSDMYSTVKSLVDSL